MNFELKHTDPRAGFNLIEIALAIFVLSLGLLAVFGLFPHGLGMADIARQETQSGMFADYVFGGLRAAAADADWTAEGFNFRNDISFNSPHIQSVNSSDHAVGHYDPGDDADRKLVEFPAHGDAGRHQTYVRYRLELRSKGDPEGTDLEAGDDAEGVGRALLTVWPGRTGDDYHKYYTEFYNFRKVEP